MKLVNHLNFILNGNSKRWNVILLMIALIIFGLNQIPFLLDMRPVMYDEPWYMNPAYNMLHGNGLQNTLVGSGGNVNFVAPLIMAGGMAIFGESLLVTRMMAVFCGFISIIVMHFILNEMKLKVLSRIFTYGIFISISLINSTFRYVRPEFAVALFVLLGILFVLRYNRTHSWGDMVLLSIFVYLASCSHPYSLFFFALIGCYYVFDVIKMKEYDRIHHLLILLLSAIFVVVTLFVVHRYANPTLEATSILSRFSISNASKAFVESMKHIFGKHILYTLPFLIVNIYILFYPSMYKWLAVINMIFVFVFPFVFSTDLAMVGNSVLYFSLISIVLFGVLFNDLMESSFNQRKKITLIVLSCMFCVGNFAVSTLFNYGKRYEKCNSILTKEIDNIIPDNSLVFGAIRLWPFKMTSTYYCDHNGKENVPKEYEYLLLNSQDEVRYKDVQILMQVKESIGNYEQIYYRDTKQYGVVTIWKHKKI